MTGRRTSKLLAAVGTGGPIIETGRATLRDDPLLWASLRLRTTLALGVVFVMVTKPAPVGALSTMAVAVAVAAPPSGGWLRSRRERKAAPTDLNPSSKGGAR
jgi:hypothetical protein